MVTVVPAAAAPPRPGDLQCGARPLRHIVWLTATGGFTAALLSAAALPDVPLPLAAVLCVIGGLTGVIALLMRGQAVGAVTAGWRLRAAPDRLAVNLRSYANHHFDPASPSVAVLPRRAVRAVRPYRRELTAEHGDTTVRHDIAALEIVLREPAPLLEQALAAEGERMGRGWLGISSRSRHRPVRLDGAVLRIYWRSPQDRITPDLAATLAQLARWYPTQGGALTAPLDPEGELLELVRAGDRLAALAKARELYGMELGEAKRFVDGLER